MTNINISLGNIKITLISTSSNQNQLENLMSGEGKMTGVKKKTTKRKMTGVRKKMATKNKSRTRESK